MSAHNIYYERTKDQVEQNNAQLAYIGQSTPRRYFVGWKRRAAWAGKFGDIIHNYIRSLWNKTH